MSFDDACKQFLEYEFYTPTEFMAALAALNQEIPETYFKFYASGARFDHTMGELMLYAGSVEAAIMMALSTFVGMELISVNCDCEEGDVCSLPVFDESNVFYMNGKTELFSNTEYYEEFLDMIDEYLGALWGLEDYEYIIED